MCGKQGKRKKGKRKREKGKGKGEKETIISSIKMEGFYEKNEVLSKKN